MHDREALHTAATLYYVQQETMDAIASHLQVSRSTVSRLLRQARDTGVVTISVAPAERGGAFTDLVRQRFGVRIHLVPARASAAPSQRLDGVARVTAGLVAAAMTDETVLGVAWGTTVSSVAAHLPSRPLRGCAVVQLNGAANQRTSGVGYAGQLLDQFAAAFDASATYFTVPAFFDFADTKTALFREASVRRVLDLQRHADLAVFGVGAFRGPSVSHVYAGGYLGAQELSRLEADGVVGDVCTVLLRHDGTWSDIELNRRASGPNPQDLARIPRRICLVSGAHKAPAVSAALRAGVITDLVIDEVTAAAVEPLLSRSA